MRVADNPAVAELQRLKPAKLRVFTRAAPDEAKAVAIPANRKRWERLGATLDGLDWLRIEALDARGNIIGVVARDDDEPTAADEVDLGGELDLAGAVGPLLGLMLKAQDMALQKQILLMKPLLDGQARLVETVTTALGAVAGAYRMALAATSTAGAGGGDNSGSDEGLGRFLQVAMMMMAQQRGPQGALGAVKAATDAARPSRSKTPAQSPPSAAAPGP